jgi:cytochrome oxidase Cu insertion factor (SCO1/SenC/PrrC family)
VRAANCAPGLFVCGILIFFGAFIFIAPARAESGLGPLPNVRVWNDADQSVALRSLVANADAGPVILLPVYTRCAASCPVLTRKLEEETARMGSGIAYRVLVISFDSGETSASLHKFREQERMPASWITVRADQPEIRRVFDFFHYTVMTEGGLLVHPNEIFLLDHDLNWRTSMAGTDWNSSDLQKNLSRIETPGLVGWIAMNPARIAVIGFAGLLLSLGFIIGWLIFRNFPRHESVRF